MLLRQNRYISYVGIPTIHFGGSFARPSLLPCKLSPWSYWTRPPMTDIFQVDRLKLFLFSLFFFFQHWDSRSSLLHIEQLAALWSYWKTMTRSSFWHNNVLCQHGIECWLGSHLYKRAEHPRFTSTVVERRTLHCLTSVTGVRTTSGTQEKIVIFFWVKNVLTRCRCAQANPHVYTHA